MPFYAFSLCLFPQMGGIRRILTLFYVLTLLSESEGWMKGKGGQKWGGHTSYSQLPQYTNPYPSPNPGMIPANDRWVSHKFN